MLQGNAIDFFTSNMTTVFGKSFCVCNENCKSVIVLKSSIFETISRIQEQHTLLKRKYDHFVLNLTDSQKNVYMQVEHGDLSKGNIQKLDMDVFQNISTSSTVENESLVKYLKEGNYFRIGDYIHTIAPSYGQCAVSSESSKPRLAICTPVFKRFALLDIWLKYMTLYLIPNLEDKGYEITLVLSGGDEEFNVAKPYTVFGRLVYLHHKNVLGDKKNILLSFSKIADFDYLAFIDSDDFFSDQTLSMLIEKANQNAFWSSVQGCCFLDILTMRAGVFSGYGEKKELYGWGLGSGRVFTKKLIKSLEDNPFPPLNKSMDFYIRQYLATFNVPQESRLIPYVENEDTYLFIGVKTDENIWKYDEYSLTPIDLDSNRIAWLPKPIVEELDTLKS